MIGVVLAAGAGRRLHPLTLDLPKTLLPVAGEDTILDIALHNLREVDVTEVAVVTGFAAERITERIDALEARHGVRITPVFNDKAEIWNNAYSLYCARDALAEGCLLVNGDTVHPAGVERTLLENRGPEILLAADTEKSLAEEEMKVILDDSGRVRRISKLLDPATAAGEYIGVSLIEASVADKLADALRATFERDTGLFYEDGYQEHADRGGDIRIAPIGTVDWVEVDNHDDLARAREIACRY
ncbi:MAG: phosphocholine cytidylyltransferase family protein [Actinomycetales bacterium]|nr:phosphocholine cytidylyltransferase family protein [Actinomycetales bacterium]